MILTLLLKSGKASDDNIYMPEIISIGLGITNRCKNQCKMCATSSTPKESEPQMPLSVANKHLEAAKLLGVQEVCLTGGEAMLHPDILKIVEHAARLGFRYIHINSGGWIEPDSQSRVQMLTRAMETTSQISQGRSSLLLDLSFSLHAFNGNQTRNMELWRTTLSGFVGMAGLIKHHWQGIPIKVGFTGVEAPKVPRIFSNVLEEFSDKNQMQIEVGQIEAFGRAAENFSGLPQRGMCSDYLDIGVFPREMKYLTFPYISPANYLFPCNSPSNGTAPLAAGLKLADKFGLEKAIEYYRYFFEEIISLRDYLYRQLGENVPFCRACIEARTQFFKEPHRMVPLMPPIWP
jgi:hypothetical protein